LCLLSAASLLAACGSPPTAPSPACSFTVGDGPAGILAAAAVEFTVAVTAQPNCSWSVSSSAAFISAVGSTTGIGSGSARFTVQPNSGLDREGTITVANKAIVVRQSGASTCLLNVSPTETTVAAGGADVAVDVSVADGANCTWTATSGSPFVTVKEGGTGSGNGRVVLTVTANAGEARVGTVTVAGRVVSLLQDAVLPSSCAFVVSPARYDVPVGGVVVGVISVTKTAGDSCPWLARTSTPWITLRNPAGGNTGTVGFDVPLNTGPARVGQIDFTNDPNGPHVTVSQASDPRAVMIAGLYLESDPGDWIGGGSGTAIVKDGTQFAAFVDPSQSTLQVAMPGGGTTYNLALDSGNGQPLAPGIYNRVARYFSQPPGTPGLSFSGNFRSCNRVTGRFMILTAQFSGQSVQRFHARFEQHCEGFSAAMRGEVWVDANGAPPPPPGHMPPPPASPVTTFSYVSDPGDLIGGGQSATMTLQSGVMAQAWARDGVPGLEVRVQTATSFGPITTNWSLGFMGPSGSRLQPGTYNNATIFPYSAPGVPGLYIWGNSHVCSSVSGSFVVTEADYGPQGEVLRFHATFEQHCNGATPALRGEIRIVADPWK